MKPIRQRTGRGGARDFSRLNGARFPLIDSNFQVYSLDRYHGSGSTGNSPTSFLNISRDYFQREARRNFLAEIAFFLVIAAILAATFIHGASAIIHFLHLPIA